MSLYWEFYFNRAVRKIVTWTLNSDPRKQLRDPELKSLWAPRTQDPMERTQYFYLEDFCWCWTWFWTIFTLTSTCWLLIKSKNVNQANFFINGEFTFNFALKFKTVEIFETLEKADTFQSTLGKRASKLPWNIIPENIAVPCNGLLNLS